MYLLGQVVLIVDMPVVSVLVICRINEASLIDERLLKKFQLNMIDIIILEK